MPSSPSFDFESQFSTAFFLITCLAVALGSPAARAQDTGVSGGGASTVPGVYNPVADPKAWLPGRQRRFTVLTPQLIRMEWAADGKFEDHASLVFLNRKLPVPNFGRDPGQSWSW